MTPFPVYTISFFFFNFYLMIHTILLLHTSVLYYAKHLVVLERHGLVSACLKMKSFVCRHSSVSHKTVIFLLLSLAVGLFIAAYVICVPSSEQSIFSTGKRASSKMVSNLYLNFFTLCQQSL